MVTVTVDNVSHTYTKPVITVALVDINIQFKHGGLYALLGPSGCGKTTLMKIIAGLMKPTKGRIYFDDADVTEWPPRRRNVAMVFQFPVVYDMSVYDNIAFPLRNYGYSESEIKKKVLEVAELVDIKDILRVNAIKLDPATRQKVAVARALVREPSVFLFDEPLSNLDPISRMELRSKIKELQKTVKTTMIYVTHDQAEALTLADYIAVMRDGKVVQFDTPANLYDYPKDTFVGYFIGNPGMNFIQCDIEEYGLKCSGFDYQLDKSIVDELIKYGNKATIGIRPEYVLVSRKSGIIRAKCILREDLGVNVLLHLELPDKSVIKSKVPYTDVREGEEVYVDFVRDKVRIFSAKGLAVT
ncbi:MAG: ABC transporter ATP-binding protein [Desulfurococcaceae archaeon]